MLLQDFLVVPVRFDLLISALSKILSISLEESYGTEALPQASAQKVFQTSIEHD
jgi:hypothetical protein